MQNFLLPNKTQAHPKLSAQELKKLEQRYLGVKWERHLLPTQTLFLQHCETFLKRAIDVLGALAALLMLSPLLIFTALAIWLEDRGPVLFSQERVGQFGRVFQFYKFRSMVRNAEALKDSLTHLNESSDGVIFKARRDPRITRVGRIIRRLSIDELPQLWNVLRGDMSLVGPRPPVPREVQDYRPEDRKRLDIRPGLTCIWQVSGRSEIPFHRQVQMDQDYILRQNLKLDFILLLKTVRAVFSGRGAY
ncbi:glycosyl transferase [bacterium (Candidatus Blackallbacteria) CG17_big_fil_post_rev_8_21_14_2_50_48_46]|uniref:Glycosyl transferase n=1 Tax=bacterium (Candidatus Blackallbacteria) CG17_big_fil_post_rev_8_21_14_2_50_48_46 TaxID=2014261 RepID=A0A2M7G5T2_9BACT|nr:MAG: glycosyl transferase [bacterium (Candidatus Blackallbacteria) CG18_big_fil_WC_8_21_14_2_50_49_26]PIW16942.1 MAG: glycosyl transferase [bacterium (Candidatus Blackallbacteria) CG17_big_fil_post_rev_8_21_14_2_50_48_46]PIW50220.1 MAG: glycosyl transferase [bacterium (Candidatus Blackallbacteria) CG13_big_fil_rev_8_21_14_2_50_49_14]